jgi:hypothetical protein
VSIQASVEYSSVRGAVRALGRATPELKERLRPAMRNAGESIRRDMQQRASYSTRIPGAIRMTTSFSARSGGVKFRVDSKRAPHARVLERGNLGGRHSTFRHPVFARSSNRSDWVWATQQTRPFFFPALKAGGRDMRKQITGAVQASLREVAR